MPMKRFAIRNKYGFGDADLCTSAGKDDPKVLLEGIAMVGLVGILRQLGDLAKFAAEVFNDLHEEVLATAARGHDLMARIHKLEAQVPFIEKSFISQANYTPFFINSGVEWRATVQGEQNPIAGEDATRFVKESCEECRDPPRFHLLDKLNFTGAGADYTDPEFFKNEAESNGMPNFDSQRKKKSLELSSMVLVDSVESCSESGMDIHEIDVVNPLAKFEKEEDESTVNGDGKPDSSFDGVHSEDDYMDALNSVESENETDKENEKQENGFPVSCSSTLQDEEYSNSEDLPPLPPLQWRMNKPKEISASSSQEKLLPALDQTKLKKVGNIVRPKLEETDSFLEQIRTQFFNLKPTSTRRTIQTIPAPKTNLKVAAILEKANAIRQALAGCDEDEDEDSWSDS